MNQYGNLSAARSMPPPQPMERIAGVLDHVTDISVRLSELRSNLKQLGDALHGPGPENTGVLQSSKPATLVLWLAEIGAQVEECHGELRRALNTLGL